MPVSAPSINSMRILRAYRLNSVENTKLRNELHVLDKSRQREVRIANQDIRMINLTLDYIKSSSGYSPEGRPPDYVEQQTRTDTGPMFLYGERLVSRKFGKKFRRAQSAFAGGFNNGLRRRDSAAEDETGSHGDETGSHESEGTGGGSSVNSQMKKRPKSSPPKALTTYNTEDIMGEPDMLISDSKSDSASVTDILAALIKPAANSTTVSETLVPVYKSHSVSKPMNGADVDSVSGKNSAVSNGVSRTVATSNSVITTITKTGSKSMIKTMGGYDNINSVSKTKLENNRVLGSESRQDSKSVNRTVTNPDRDHRTRNSRPDTSTGTRTVTNRDTSTGTRTVSNQDSNHITRGNRPGSQRKSRANSKLSSTEITETKLRAYLTELSDNESKSPEPEVFISPTDAEVYEPPKLLSHRPKSRRQLSNKSQEMAAKVKEARAAVQKAKKSRPDPIQAWSSNAQTNKEKDVLDFKRNLNDFRQQSVESRLKDFMDAHPVKKY